MNRRYLVSALVAWFAASSAIGAEDWPVWSTPDYENVVGCGQTDLLHSSQAIRFVGSNPEKADEGDRRILYWSLRDLDGEIIGSFDVLSTVLDTNDPRGDTVRAEGLLTLATGDIFIEDVVHLQDASDASRSGEDEEVFVLRISGGTGEFVNSTGKVVITVPKEGEDHLKNRPITLHIDC